MVTREHAPTGQFVTPGSVIDRYTVEAFLGEGGVAIVYKARHNQLGTLHALKIVKVAAGAIHERLLQEGRVQATLRHQNIVPVTDVVDIEGTPGLVMEFVDGPTLSELMAMEQLTIEQADAVAFGLLDGVGFAHNKGMIHRDLKPDNILVEITETDLIPKVTDFGLAKLLDPDADPKKRNTRQGIAMGTPNHMAPEQIRDAASAGIPADVFSLGTILYELYTGHEAFPGDDIIAVFNSIGSGRYIRPSQHCPELPDRVEQAIVGALQTDLKQRIPDCQHLLKILRGGGRSKPMSQEVVPWTPGQLSRISLQSSEIHEGDGWVTQEAAMGTLNPSGTDEVEALAVRDRVRPSSNRAKSLTGGRRRREFDPSTEEVALAAASANPPMRHQTVDSIEATAKTNRWVLYLAVGLIALLGIGAGISGALVYVSRINAERQAQRTPAKPVPTIVPAVEEPVEDPQVDVEPAAEPTVAVVVPEPRRSTRPQPKPKVESVVEPVPMVAEVRAGGTPAAAPTKASVHFTSTERGTLNCDSPKSFDGVLDFEIAAFNLPATCLVQIGGLKAAMQVDRSGFMDCVQSGGQLKCRFGDEPLPPLAVSEPQGFVEISGDVDDVWLITARGQRFEPGPVPVGTYQVVADFEGMDPMPAASVMVEADQRLEVNCVGALTMCAAK